MYLFYMWMLIKQHPFVCWYECDILQFHLPIFEEVKINVQ